MNMIIIEFDQNDLELREALAQAFGDQMGIVETKNFDSGAANIVQVLVPVVSTLTPLLVAYFARPRSAPLTRRVVITNKGGVTLEGYTAEEVDRLIERVRSDAPG